MVRSFHVLSWKREGGSVGQESNEFKNQSASWTAINSRWPRNQVPDGHSESKPKTPTRCDATSAPSSAGSIPAPSGRVGKLINPLANMENFMKRNCLELWFRKQYTDDLVQAVLQPAPEDFLVARMTWPSDEIDTSQEGMVSLVRAHLHYCCKYQDTRLHMGHGCMIVVPGTDMAVLLWWLHKYDKSYGPFVPLTDIGLGYYVVPCYSRSDHPSYRALRTDEILYIARGGVRPD